MEIIKHGKHYQLNQEKGTFVCCPECDKKIYIDIEYPYQAICTFCACEFSFTKEDIDVEINLDRAMIREAVGARHNTPHIFKKVR